MNTLRGGVNIIHTLNFLGVMISKAHVLITIIQVILMKVRHPRLHR